MRTTGGLTTEHQGTVINYAKPDILGKVLPVE